MGGARRRQNIPAAAERTACLHGEGLRHTVGRSFSNSVWHAYVHPLTHSQPPTHSQCDCAGLKRLQNESRSEQSAQLGEERGRQRTQEGCGGVGRGGGQSDSRLQGEAEMKEAGEERDEDG